MELLHGFRLVAEEFVEDRKTLAMQYEHAKTGAKVLVLHNTDENKAFAISFATPPEDSTGVAHIMEHSVLCGSEKFPLKEPFVELLKGSLQTFLNAFTGSVETYYPVASQNRADFYNLITVYLDAVFFPRLTPEVLQQEGWHYELSEDLATLNYKGVVFNEMKGAHSSPDREIYEHLEKGLFPNTPAHHDSGGATRSIPNLTWEYFQQFHKTYYQPSNSISVLYGDDESHESLRLLDSYFSRFNRTKGALDIPLQPRFSEPKVLNVRLPGDRSEDDDAMIAIGWIISDTIAPKEILLYRLLSHILVGTPASPLRQELLTSGLVKDVSGGADHDRQVTFALKLKGVNAGRLDDVQALVHSILRSLARDGIPAGAVEAALNTLEFGLRESNTGSFPKGLALAFEALSGWRYDDMPIGRLSFENDLQSIRMELEHGGMFESLVSKLLLSNTHRVTVIGTTDPDLTKNEDDNERVRLKEIRANLSDSDIKAIQESNRRRLAWQDGVDSKEALASLPSLGLEDLDRSIKTIPTQLSSIAGVVFHEHDLFTNGIVYLELAFDLAAVPLGLLPFTRLYCRSLREMGTNRRNYINLLQEIGISTGGISATPFFTVSRREGTTVAKIIIRGKSTVKQSSALIRLLMEILTEPNLADGERLNVMAHEEQARLIASIIPAGSRYAESRLRSQFHPADRAEEVVSGLSYIQFIKQLNSNDRAGSQDSLGSLNTLHNAIIRKENLIVNITADGASIAALKPELEALILALPAGGLDLSLWSSRSKLASEGVIIPSPVNYVATAVNLYEFGYVWEGSIDAITRYINTVWLWERVRVRGGAYGGAARFDPSTGVLTFSSYRDPNLDSTLEIFRQTGRIMSDLTIDREELVRLTIGTVGGLDTYQLPDSKGHTALVRALVGDSDEHRQRRRDQVLALKLEDFRAFGQVLAKAFDDSVSVALAGREAIEQSEFYKDADFSTLELS